VLVDMVPLLARTGFDAAALRHDQNRDTAERVLGAFAGHYQGDVNEPRPIWQRDLSAELRQVRERALLSVGEGI
jgi:uncharacterized protein (DUF934 family)